MKLGLDIGRVLIARASTTGDTSFMGQRHEEALRTPAYAGMFEVVPKLVKHFDKTWLISKCGPAIQDRTRAWLTHHQFFERTGIPSANLIFVRKRPEKAQWCAEIAITHFIDDRYDVLEAMEGIVPHRYLFGPQEPGVKTGESIVMVKSWAEVERMILGAWARACSARAGL